MLWSLVAWDDWRPLSRRRYDDEPVVRRQAVVDDNAAGVRPTVRRVYR